MIYLVYGADRFAEYKRVDTPTYGVGSTYKGVNGAAGVFKYVAAAGSEPETYTLNDQNGSELVFIGFDGNAHSAAGQLWKITDTAGNVAYVGDSSTAGTAIDAANSYQKGYDSSGRMKVAYDSSGRKYSYAYTQLNSVYRLTQIKAEKNTGSWVMVAQVDYAYYGSETYGEIGDLKTVTVGLAECRTALNR